MAKTGTETTEGTAEGALLGRAAHARHDADPVLNDTWAADLLTPQSRAALEGDDYWKRAEENAGFDSRPILAVSLACLRHADERVGEAVAEGIDQYVILGAGFDTFALRHDDLADSLRVFEVDFPDVQELKRARIAAAERRPAAMPEFVPIDFETTKLSQALSASGFDPKRPAFFSWLNTIPYISAEAVRATIDDLAHHCAAGSLLFLNYSPAVALSEAQKAYIATLMSVVAERSEPLRSSFVPDEMAKLLEEAGFRVREHLDEAELSARYFEGRSDGLRPGLPARAVLAELVGKPRS